MTDVTRITLDVPCDTTTRTFVELAETLQGRNHKLRYDGFMGLLHIFLHLWHTPRLFTDKPEPDAKKTKSRAARQASGGQDNAPPAADVTAGGNEADDDDNEITCVTNTPRNGAVRNCNVFIENVPHADDTEVIVARRVHFFFYHKMANVVKALRNFFNVYKKPRYGAALRKEYHKVPENIRPYFCEEDFEQGFIAHCVAGYALNPSEDAINDTLLALSRGATGESVATLKSPWNIIGIRQYYMQGASHLRAQDIHPDFINGDAYGTGGPVDQWFPDLSYVFYVSQLVTMRPTALFVLHVKKVRLDEDDDNESQNIEKLSRSLKGLQLAAENERKTSEVYDAPNRTLFENLMSSLEREFKSAALQDPVERAEYCRKNIQRFSDAVHAPASLSCTSIMALSQFLRENENADEVAQASRPWFFMDYHFAVDATLTPLGNYMAHLVHMADAFGDENAMYGNFELLCLILVARDSAFFTDRDLRDNHCLHGMSQTGKSTAMMLTRMWSVPGTVEIIGRQTPQAVTAAVNNDYMFHAYDEMPEALFGNSGPNGSKTGNATMKVAMTMGEVTTNSIVVENGERKSHTAHSKTNVTYLFNTNDDATKELDESFQSRSQINYCTRTVRKDKDGTFQGLGSISDKDRRVVKVEQKVHAMICLVNLMMGAGFLLPVFSKLTDTYFSLYMQLCALKYGVEFQGRHIKIVRRRFTILAIRSAILQYFFVEADEHFEAHPTWTLEEHLLCLQPYLVTTTEHFVFAVSMSFKYTFQDERYMVLRAMEKCVKKNDDGTAVPAENPLTGEIVPDMYVLELRSDKLHSLSPRIRAEIKKLFDVDIDVRYVTRLLYGFESKDLVFGGKTRPVIERGNTAGSYHVWQSYTDSFIAESSARKCLLVLMAVLSHAHKSRYRCLTGITYNYFKDYDTNLEDAEMGHYLFYSFTPLGDNQTSDVPLKVRNTDVHVDYDKDLYSVVNEILDSAHDDMFVDLDKDFEEFCVEQYRHCLQIDDMKYPAEMRDISKEVSRKRGVEDGVYPELYLRANKRLRGTNQHQEFINSVVNQDNLPF